MEHVNSSKQTEQVTQLDVQDTPGSQSTQVSAIAPVDSAENIPKPRKSLKFRQVLPRVIFGVVLGAGAIAVGIYTYRWREYAKFHPQTDNAYITADIYPVTSRVGGIVTQVAIKDNQVVNPGDLLVTLDPRQYQVSLAQAKADLDLAKEQAEVAKENVNLVTTNIQETVRPLVIPTIPGNVPGNRAFPAKLPPVNTQSINKQIEVNRQQYKAAVAAIAQKQAELKQAELELSYTKINALTGGQVGNKIVRVGQQVQPGQTLMEVVQPSPWIVANFKENQLEKIRPGQKATIKMVAFPSRKFEGKVDSISPTSVSRFAPPPANNSTDNSNLNNTNNVERLSIKIVFDPESIRGYESRIAPGMSADVTVDAR
jgi:membrane fusion protein, multidrug efflux system